MSFVRCAIALLNLAYQLIMQPSAPCTCSQHPPITMRPRLTPHLAPHQSVTIRSDLRKGHSYKTSTMRGEEGWKRAQFCRQTIRITCVQCKWRGRRGVKKTKIFENVFYIWPLTCFVEQPRARAHQVGKDSLTHLVASPWPTLDQTQHKQGEGTLSSFPRLIDKHISLTLIQ